MAEAGRVGVGVGEGDDLTLCKLWASKQVLDMLFLLVIVLSYTLILGLVHDEVTCVADHFSAGVRQHRLLDDVPAHRLPALRHVPHAGHPDLVGGTESGTPDRGSHLPAGQCSSCIIFSRRSRAWAACLQPVAPQPVCGSDWLKGTCLWLCLAERNLSAALIG